MNFTKNYLFSALAILFSLFSLAGAESIKPNILYILADDMGYGDVQALAPETSKVPTPHMDQLIAEGMSFTDAHTCSAVCTPTRYGLLTGRYNWRSRMTRGVLNGTAAPLIPAERMTVASLLKEAGYDTAMVGKWHLGLGVKKNGKKGIDWAGEITGGPVDLGFDYWYGIAASLDFPPYVYIENNKFVGEGSVTKAFHRPGPAHPDFEAVEVLDTLAEKSCEYLVSRKEKEEPFFLYVPLTSPHTPILPSEEWQGKSGLGDYGDFMMQTDDIIGRIIKAVDENGFKENTLVIVSSDNGCAFKADIPGLKAQGHHPNAHFRGMKMELWDGGHRVPHIVRWPAVVKPGTECDALVLMNDFVATCSEIVGRPLADHEAEDSVSFLSALKGQPIVTERKGIVHHSFHGNFAYRSDKWKLILGFGSGGPNREDSPKKGENDPQGQLYDMEADPSETKNLYNEHPEIVAELMAQLKKEVADGRSTPGAPQKNDSKSLKLK